MQIATKNYKNVLFSDCREDSVATTRHSQKKKMLSIARCGFELARALEELAERLQQSVKDKLDKARTSYKNSNRHHSDSAGQQDAVDLNDKEL